MKNVMIDYTQAMDVCGILERHKITLTQEDREKFYEKIQGKRIFPDCGCGRACIYLKDYINAIMEMDNFTFYQLTVVWEVVNEMIVQAIGIPNWKVMQEKIPKNGKKQKYKKFKSPKLC